MPMEQPTAPTPDTARSTAHRPDAATLVLLAGVLAVLFVVGVQLARQNQPPSAPQPGGSAPDFALQTFDGETLRLSQQRGSIVVLNFWGSWCLPCADEAPALQAAWETYRERGVSFIGVAYRDADAPARAFIARFGVTYPNGLDIGSSVSTVYRIQGAPETFVINRTGSISPVYDSFGSIMPHYFGPLTLRGLAQTLDTLLAGAVPE